MKKKGNCSDYVKERNQNLRREFYARLGTNGMSLNEVYDAMTLAPADRFYISEERAEQEIKKLDLKNFNEIPEDAFAEMKNPRRREMMREILKRVKVLMTANPELELRDAVYQTVNSPAPSFYLTRASIRTTLYEA